MPLPSEADKTLQLLQKLLPTSLVAVYLHGSAVKGGLRPKSDLDILAVVEHPLPVFARDRLVSGLMDISAYPVQDHAVRPVELVIFSRNDLTKPTYPARYEFLYGEWLRQQFEKGTRPEPGHDPEFTLVLAQARQYSKPLMGPSAIELLPAISWADIVKATKDILPGLIASLPGDENNVLLTLARMWLTLVTRQFVSKDAAANWAAKRLPAENARVLTKARNFYLGSPYVNWPNEPQDLQKTVNVLHDCILRHLQ